MALSRGTLPKSLSAAFLGKPSRTVYGHNGLIFVDLKIRRLD